MENKEYREIFGIPYERKYSAPARINIIGEHIDYNGGKVLPCAISLSTTAYVNKRSDRLVCLYSKNMKTYVERDLNDLAYNKENGWANYPLGVFKVMRDKGYKINHGLNIYFESDIPLGSGLSSSASLLDLTVFLVAKEFHFDVSLKEVALLAQTTENTHCGLSCGIMDEAIIALGKENSCIELDCSDFTYEYVPLELDNYRFCVLQTNKTRLLTESKYNDRVKECNKALTILKKHYELDSLSDLKVEDLENVKALLQDEVLYKRVKHVVTENKRVEDAMTALKYKDYALLGKILNEGDASLKEDYEVTGLHLDTITKAARLAPGCLGARMTGAGFGGCAIALIEKDQFEAFKKQVENEYFLVTSIKPSLYLVDVAGGPKRISYIYDYIKTLFVYCLKKGLVKESDETFFANQILNLYDLHEYREGTVLYKSLAEILEFFTMFAINRGLIEDSQCAKERFDTDFMAMFLDKPSTIIENFNRLYEVSPKDATTYFYELNKASNYIRMDRIQKDVKWKTDTKYGKLDITINLSKPEKDPRDIAKAKLEQPSTYPKCLLCMENEGYHGKGASHPDRANLRLIPLSLGGEEYFMQYSPYVYYNEHCIVLNKNHIPMVINKKTFEHLLDFVTYLPHYFLGSNADLPIVGGSILSHDHYQGGHYHFAMEEAKNIYDFRIKGFENIDCHIVYWPLSVIRLEGKEKGALASAAEHILNQWINYEDKELSIIPFSGDVRHHTITPIARFKNGLYQLDLVLRSNITTKEHPLGLFHPHEDCHHIKKENIGLIEVMGLAVLPSRLIKELALVKKAILENIEFDESIIKHAAWAKHIEESYVIHQDNIDRIFEEEVGKVFAKVLEDAGVFKMNELGIEHFKKFVNSL